MTSPQPTSRGKRTSRIDGAVYAIYAIVSTAALPQRTVRRARAPAGRERA